jgi:UDP-galactose transporter B1
LTAGGAASSGTTTTAWTAPPAEVELQHTSPREAAMHLEMENSERELDTFSGSPSKQTPYKDHDADNDNVNVNVDRMHLKPAHRRSARGSHEEESSKPYHELVWLLICFLGIMFSFVGYGLLLEYTTSGGRKLHELSFLFVTSALYTLTAAAGRYVRDETPTTIPPARFAVLGLTSMGSTFCSVRSLRYVIFPIQVLAKSCKPVPVMLMGALMGKRYPLSKYANVVMIVVGVALFMGGGDKKKASVDADPADSASQLIGILLLFISLCFDGGTGAYEDKLMSVHSVQVRKPQKDNACDYLVIFLKQLCFFSRLISCTTFNSARPFWLVLGCSC